MNTLTKPIQTRNASEALRYAKTMERAEKGDFAIWPDGNGIVTVDSFKMVDGKRAISRYTVDMNAGTCTCPDFENRKDYCKHILRVDMVAKQEDEEAHEQFLIDQYEDRECANGCDYSDHEF